MREGVSGSGIWRVDFVLATRFVMIPRSSLSLFSSLARNRNTGYFSTPSIDSLELVGANQH